MGVCTSHEVHNAVDVRVVTEPPSKLIKRESDTNLVVGEIETRWHTIDESEFDSERFMVVCAPSVSAEYPGKIFIYDVDYQSRTYGQRVSELTLPRNGDEFLYASWARSAAKSSEVNSLSRQNLVVPCFNTSRVYVLGIDSSNQIRISKCIELQELSMRDASFPLDCFSCPGRGTPLLCSFLGDKNGSPKGTFAKIDRKNFSLIPQRINDDERPTFSTYGGTFAVHTRQNLLISTEWGYPRHIQLGFQLSNNNDDNLTVYGSSLNVWDLEPLIRRQRLELDRFDGNLPISIRFVHNPELTHAFCCTVGGGLFHLHRNTRTEQFAPRKAFQFAVAHVSGWIQEEVPAVPVDIIISMNDQNLFVSCWLQGFVQNFNISDPFNVSPLHRVFLGGIIHDDIKLLRISTIVYSFMQQSLLSLFQDFTPKKQKLKGIDYQGGPSKLQLSLDGRRLYVGNSFLRSWDDKIYPEKRKHGGLIALIHINVNSACAMTLDENFVIDLNSTDDSEVPNVPREMRFLNGDCKSL
ncbi:putative selenium-binding protein [Aphelenchoides besseyi]|nr:putative selenium-binding protein [Aphelenchoides besseyi]